MVAEVGSGFLTAHCSVQSSLCMGLTLYFWPLGLVFMSLPLLCLTPEHDEKRVKADTTRADH